MPTIEVSVDFQQPIEEVFEYLSDAANLPTWDSTVLTARKLTPPPLAVGSQTAGTSKVLGYKFEWTTEVTHYEPPTKIVFQATGAFGFRVTNTFEPHDGGTRFTYRIDADSGLGAIFGRLADPIVAKAQTRSVRANLETLAEVLTARQAAEQ